MGTSADNVAIALFTHKSTFSELEMISVRQCSAMLSAYSIYVVYPDHLRKDTFPVEIRKSMELLPMPSRWFRTIRDYNRMKILPLLYETFSRFHYLLTYETDAFVFRDDLIAWCDEAWDYIGAPWFEGVYDVDENSAFTGVGNSGFSLRKISSCRKVMKSFRYITPAKQVFTDPRWIRHKGLKRVAAMAANVTVRNRFHSSMNSWKGNEDFFWGLHADRRFSWWRTADYDSASRFSFEANAPRLYQEIGGLPFGCHKWTEIHRDFWRPHIESFGHSLPKSY